MNSIQPCLACDSSEVTIVLDLGPQPPANLLMKEAGGTVETTRLALAYCDTCGHSQQAEFFPREKLFSDYLYQSGTSQTLKEYFLWFSEALLREAGKQANVLEIASNDGTFLQELALRGVTVMGIDPAQNLVDICNDKGIPAIADFWPTQKITTHYDRIVAMNVLAHGPCPRDFLQAIYNNLSPDGLAYIQVSQIDMFVNFEFDTLYHEHYSFFCANSLRVMAESVGFTSFAFVKTDIHGGSLLAILGSKDSSVEIARQQFSRGRFFLQTVDLQTRPKKNDALIFGIQANEICTTLRLVCTMARQQGRSVVMVGVAAKAVTVLQASALEIDFAVDEAPLKKGRYLPNTEIRIKELEFVSNIEGNCIFIIGAWNFKRELSEKLKKYRPNQEDFICTYFPRFTVSPLFAA